jgi:hypothetical protein
MDSLYIPIDAGIVPYAESRLLEGGYLIIMHTAPVSQTRSVGVFVSSVEIDITDDLLDYCPE